MAETFKVTAKDKEGVTIVNQYYVGDDKYAAIRYWTRLFPGASSICIEVIQREKKSLGEQPLLPGI